MDRIFDERKIAFLLFLFALIFQALVMPQHLVYDEFWSLIFFSPLSTGEIFTNLSLPNNHPLNTILLKIIFDFVPNGFALRAGSMICGAIIPILCGKLAFKWSMKNNLCAMACAGILTVLSAPIIVYGGLARGYALQLFFLLLCTWSLTEVKDHPRRSAMICFISAVGVILSVPTGILFLFPLGAGYLIFSAERERRNMAMWIAAAAIAVFSAFYYGMNFQALRTSSTWGTDINSVSTMLFFLCAEIGSLLFVPSLVSTVPTWIYSRKRSIAAGLLFVPILLAFFSNGAPARCYLYLSAALCIAGGIGIAEFCGRYDFRRCYALIAAAVLGAGSFFIQLPSWESPDHIAAFEKIMAEIPKGTIPVFRATSGFPIACGAEEKLLASVNSMFFREKIFRAAVFDCPNGVLNGCMPESYSEKTAETDLSGELFEYGGEKCFVYDLEAVDRLPANEYGIAVIRRKSDCEKFEKEQNMLYLNIWLLEDGAAVFCRGSDLPDDIPSTWTIYRIKGAE